TMMSSNLYERNPKKQSRWRIASLAIPIVFLVLLTKWLVHFLGFEYFSLHPLFLTLASANMFLAGFLLLWVIAEYKESEKIPGEMAAAIHALSDEGYIIFKNTKSDIARNYLYSLQDFSKSLLSWFNGKERTATLMQKLFRFNDAFLEFEKITEKNFIARLKQEQSHLRRLINHVRIVRETSVLSALHVILEIVTGTVVMILIFMKTDGLYDGFLFVAAATFISIYAILLIKDLGNPFEYETHGARSKAVSLNPLYDTERHLRSHLHVHHDQSRYIVFLQKPIPKNIPLKPNFIKSGITTSLRVFS
ncbi:MAG: hypothetical protein WCT48_05540, partial [Candidatus Paceibacterota bacterium]